MVKVFKNIVLNQKVLFGNFISLFVLQGSNYIIPLILLPYLIYTLGIENFGLLAFATATISFFRAIVSYGFDLSGTKQIALNQNNHENINEIFNSIITVKFILAIICLIFLSMLVLLFDKFNQNIYVFLVTYIIIFGDLLFPIWFFQGIEKMKFITYLKLSYKILFLFLVLLLVKTEDDFILVPLLDSIGSIIIGFFAIFIIGKKYAIKYTIPSFMNIKYQFKNGWHIFISNIAVIFYTSINTFLLGLMTNNLLVGYYSVAEKIYFAIRGLLEPLTQALFPFLSRKYKSDQNNYYKIIKRISLIYFFILIQFAIITYYFRQDIIKLITGDYNIQTTEILSILSVALIFAIGGLFSSFLIIKGKNNLLSEITFKSMILNLILIIPSIYYLDIYGVAITMLIVQMFHFYLQIVNNKEIFKGQ